MENLTNLFIELFGEYQPTITEIMVGEEVQQVASVNWSYIFPVLIFMIVLSSFLKILGGVICAK